MITNFEYEMNKKEKLPICPFSNFYYLYGRTRDYQGHSSQGNYILSCFWMLLLNLECKWWWQIMFIQYLWWIKFNVKHVNIISCNYHDNLLIKEIYFLLQMQKLFRKKLQNRYLNSNFHCYMRHIFLLYYTASHALLYIATYICIFADELLNIKSFLNFNMNI